MSYDPNASPDEQLTNDTELKPLECDSHHPIIGAIDLGTNSCRLLVARINIAGVRTNYFRSRPRPIAWKVIDSFAKVVRLGEGLSASEELSADAIDRAMEALGACRKKLDRYHLQKLRVVATEACRRATNNHVLIDRAKAELNLHVEIIDSDEEAKLALKGCAAILDYRIPYGIVFDIGGGSTEVILVRFKQDGRRHHSPVHNFDVVDSISVPYGVVTTTEDVGQSLAMTEAHQFLHDKIASQIKGFVTKNNLQDALENGEVQVTGSSGTVTTLAAFHLGLPQYDRRVVDGMTISYENLLGVIENILHMSREERLEKACIGFGRADYVITGSVILKALCSALPTKTMRIADRGVREGILLDLMNEILKV